METTLLKPKKTLQRTNNEVLPSYVNPNVNINKILFLWFFDPVPAPGSWIQYFFILYRCLPPVSIIFTISKPLTMSAPKEDQLLVAKQRLMYALGDSQPIYLANLKQWFRQKWTKEEFDRESRKLLGLDQAHLHNQFFLALLNKIEPLHAKCPVVDSVVGSATSQRAATFQNSSVMMDGVNPTLVQPMNVPPRVGADAGVSSSAAKRRKRSSRPTADRATFDSADVFDYLAEESFDGVRPPGAISPPRSLSPQRFSVQELFLPDAGLVMGRLLVGAWESGLVSAEENVSELIVLAVQVIRGIMFLDIKRV